MTEQTTRVHYSLFGAWRFLAASFIAIYHFSAYAGEPLFAWGAKLEPLYPMLDMFFMLSGFLIMSFYGDKVVDRTTYKDFMVRRIARIYPLHLLTLSFFLCVAVAVNSGLVSTGEPQRYAWSELPAELFLVQACGTTNTLAFNYTSWSLSAEWFCYVAFPFLLLIYSRCGAMGLMFVFFASVVALEGLTAAGVMPFPTWLDANTWGAYRAFADFVLGTVIACLVRANPAKSTSHTMAWGFFFLLWVVMLFDVISGYVIIVGLSLAVYFAASVDGNAPEKGRYLRPMEPLFAASFGIYLWHPVVAAFLYALLWRKVLEPAGAGNGVFVLVTLVALALTYAVALISMRYLEAPMRDWIIAVFTKREAARKTPGAGKTG